MSENESKEENVEKKELIKDIVYDDCYDSKFSVGDDSSVLYSFLKSLGTSDVTSISLPSYFFEKRSFLEKSSDSLAYQHLILK
jgi:hypothetical protein